MLRFWNVIVLVLNFESFFCDLLASVCLVNKNDAKVSIKTKTKTMPVQNIFRYISCKSVSLKMSIFYSLFFKNKSPQVKPTNICLHRSNFSSKILVLVGCARLSFTSVVILYCLLHRVWIFWKHVGFHASHFLFVKINRLSPNYGPVQCTWPMEYGPLVELLSLLFIFNLHFSCIIATISQ